MVAKSGEVYYTVNGNLHMLDNMELYNAMISKKQKLENTYFEILVNGEYNKLLVSRTNTIMNLIFQLPLTEQVQAIQNYQALCEEVGI